MPSTLLLAAAQAGSSRAPFYVFAAALVAFALSLSAVGVARHETFPPSRGLATALIGVCIVLVAGTMLSAVLTA